MKLRYSIGLFHKNNEVCNLYFVCSRWQILRVFHAIGFLLPCSNIQRIVLSTVDSHGHLLNLSEMNGDRFVSKMFDKLSNFGG